MLLLIPLFPSRQSAQQAMDPDGSERVFLSFAPPPTLFGPVGYLDSSQLV